MLLQPCQAYNSTWYTQTQQIAGENMILKTGSNHTAKLLTTENA